MRGPSIHYMEDDIISWKRITLTEPTQESWFDDEGYPLTSRDSETGRFVNPWLSESSNGENGVRNFLRWKVGGAWSRFMDAAVGLFRNHLRLGQETIVEERREKSTRHDIIAALTKDNSITPSSAHTNYLSQCQTLTTTVNEQQSTNDAACIRLTWIGHSTTLVTFPGNFTILTDPHFHSYAGPVHRTVPPALGVTDLPEIVDCVLISHDHMDHLDYRSILELIDSNKVQFWVVPLGIKSWLMDKPGIYPENIIELEWWQGVRLRKRVGGKYSNVTELVRAVDSSVTREDHPKKDIDTQIHDILQEEEKDELLITCAPAQHWCSRTPFDRNKRLWCSFAVHATTAHVATEPGQQRRTPGSPRTYSFFFAGDTGLPSEFPLHHQIGDRLGPFDLCAIPIGAYTPDWFMRESHCNPVEAVTIHQAIRSTRSVAIHYDTFDLADEPREEPPRLLLAEVGRVNAAIARVAAEVVDVVEGVGIVSAQLGKSGGMIDAVGVSPPLVDFVAIQQGQSIDSLPK